MMKYLYIAITVVFISSFGLGQSIQLNEIGSKKYKLKIKNENNFYKIHKILNIYIIVIFLLFLLIKFTRKNEHK